MTKSGYIGSYTKKEGKGIYRFVLDEDKAAVTEVATAYEIEASTFIARHNQFLYAITKEGERCGVASFRVENDGTLTLLNKCLDSVEGTGCYISVSEDGNYLFEAVYGAGLLRLYELDVATGEVVRLIEELEHKYPTGPHERQEHAHVHYVQQTPDKKYVAACDLGTDRVVSYTYDEEGYHEAAVSEFTAGYGPRHIAFHENQPYAYVVHELSNKVSVTKYDDGHFEEVGVYVTIPDDFREATKLAAVHLSHDQHFLYVSNRGHDSIAVFEVSDKGDTLKLVEIVKTGGEFPRDFNISDDDQYIVCAHQEGDSPVTVLKRNKETGQLTLTDDKQHAAEGVCVIFD
ncbi:6-phosphogluconolactonase [Staphylococcus simulans]|uniref:6-phosphogluconolactonase n=1 Tax=Staphylococcus simulans TaxID=1286 RepID=UPI0028A334B4|nr:lactonase family protein [Staphylococcus simulans]MDT4011954.1 lactonase family protein [Staphylococcus simulans]